MDVRCSLHWGILSAPTKSRCPRRNRTGGPTSAVAWQKRHVRNHQAFRHGLLEVPAQVHCMTIQCRDTVARRTHGVAETWLNTCTESRLRNCEKGGGFRIARRATDLPLPLMASNEADVRAIKRIRKQGEHLQSPRDWCSRRFRPPGATRGTQSGGYQTRRGATMMARAASTPCGLHAKQDDLWALQDAIRGASIKYSPNAMSFLTCASQPCVSHPY